MYAQLCKRIEKELETDIDKNKSGTFLQILLNVCRDKFENRVQYSEKIINSESTLTDDLEEKKNVAKQKILGNVKFIGELYKLDMLAEPHLHKMLRSLFTNKSSSTTEKNCEDMECLAQLIRTCGKNLDTELGKQLMDQYFDRMEQYSHSSKFPPRIRFMLRDLIELRKNNWTPRKVALVEGPAPIQELNHDDDVLPPSLNHLRNRDRDYRNNDRSEQRDWISKFSLNLQHMNDGFNLMSVSSPSTLLPSSYNHSSNGYASRDHRDNGGVGSNYRIHSNRNNQNNYNNNRYNKHNHHHYQSASAGNGSLNNGSNANLPYGNMINNKDLAPRFKRNLMTPPQNSVEELQMRPTPNSLLFKANMSIKTHLPISSPMGGNTVGGSASKVNYNAQSLSEYPSPHMGRTLLSEQRNAGQNSVASATNGNFTGSCTSLMDSVDPQGSPSTMIDDNVFNSGEPIDGSKNIPSTPNHFNSANHAGGPRLIVQNSGNNQCNAHQNKLPNHCNNQHQQQQYCHNNSQGNRTGVTKMRDFVDSGMDANKNAYMIKNYNHQQQTVLPETDIIRPLCHDSIALHTPPNPLATQAKSTKEKVVVSKSSLSENKVEKKIKREKGPGKEEYMKRVVKFFNDVMVANIEQQIEEEKLLNHAFSKKEEEVRSFDAEETKTLLKEVLVEVIDKTEHLESSCIDAITGFNNGKTNYVKNESNGNNDASKRSTDYYTHSDKKIYDNETKIAMSVKTTESEEQHNDEKTDHDLISNTGIDNEPVPKDVIEKKNEETGNAVIPASVIISYEMEHTVSSTLNCAKEQNPNLKHKLVREFCDLKIPEKCMRDAVIKILNEVLDRSDAYQAKTIEFLLSLKNEAKLSNVAALESFRAIINGMSEKEKTIPKITTIVASLLARGVIVNLCQLTDIASCVDNGQHYPLFLLVLQQLHKQLGRIALLELFRKSGVDLMSSLPESDRSKDRMAEILEDRNLSFLYPLLRVQSELWKQIQADSNPQQFYKWIKENVEPGCFADSGFITAVMTVLLKYIGQETDKLTEDKKRVEKEKEILAKYCPVLNAFLNGYYDRQLTAIYAIQVYWFNIGYPKGVLLRWFQEMYELSVIEEDAFLQYKEDVNDIYPGKGKALFQVNQWLTWLAEAEDEDDEEDD
ncbi:ras guanine nucleotide exchange factor P-like [Anopheles albimanus]|nr:ras guanine nucleotide exchange factor P-like [Anopheles albimanus]